MKKCCVLIPYFEAANALLDSLESIESVDGLGVMIVDDGSEQWPAQEILRGYHTELKIDLIRLPKNRGIEHALNAGLSAIKDSYEYVARLDCGDRSINDRLSKQITYLDEHQSCGLVGGWAEYVFPDRDTQFIMRHPTDPGLIRRRMYVNNPFTHSAVMFRSAVVDVVGLYPLNRPAAEDFAFFRNIAAQYEVANFPEPLVQYVVDPRAISATRRAQQIRSRIAILIEHFEPRGIAVYGLARAVLQLPTPRGLTISLHRFKNLRTHRSSARSPR